VLNQPKTADPASNGRIDLDARNGSKSTSPIRRFLEANVRVSRRLDFRINPDHGTVERNFMDTIHREMMELPEGATIADLGAGHRSGIVDIMPKDRALKLVGVDISAEQLAQNQDVTEGRVANIAEGLPFRDGEVALVLSHCLLEHVDGVPVAVRDMSRVLAPGGSAIHYLPCRFSTFGTAARLLPFGPLLKVLHWALPETKGWIGFDVFYDHCYPAAMKRLFYDAGFRRVDVQVEYSSTEFFFTFLPLFLLVSLYERVVKKMDARSLAAHMMVYAQR
jgi:SAM-dependent methyltransferase